MDHKEVRAILDDWAHWIEARNAAEFRRLNYPCQDTTSRMADFYGERADKRTGKAVVAAPIDYATTEEERAAAFAKMDARTRAAKCERVDAFMATLRIEKPLHHLCIEAKHRRVIGSIRVGSKRGKNGRTVPMKDYDLAEACIKGAMTTTAKSIRFSRLCGEVYENLAEHLTA